MSVSLSLIKTAQYDFKIFTNRLIVLQTMWNSRTIPWRLRHSSASLGMLSVTHIMPVLVLLSVVGEECNSAWSETIYLIFNTKWMQVCSSFRQLFPDNIFPMTFPWFLVKSLTFPWQLSNSQTFPGFPDNWSPCTKLGRFVHIVNKNNVTAIRSWPTSSSTLASYHRCSQHNGRQC